MSLKLNENQLIAVYLIASGVKASAISKQLNIRAETLSRWRQDPEFKTAVMDATEIILEEIINTHKNLLITSQKIILEALNNQELDCFKKTNVALRYLSLIKGKDDISQKSSRNYMNFIDTKDFDYEFKYTDC